MALDPRIATYGYIPSLELCIVALLYWSFVFLLHLVSLIRFRTRYSVPYVIGCAIEFAGYAIRLRTTRTARAASALYVAQYCLVVAAPIIWSAAIYTAVHRMTRMYGNTFVPLNGRQIILLFCTCDVICTIVQIAGATMLGRAYSRGSLDPLAANDVILAGLVFQSFAFACFVSIIANLIWKTRSIPVKQTKIPFGFRWTVMTSTILIYIRTVFRMAERAGGRQSYLITHEVFYGVFEFTPSALAVFWLGLWHPGRYLINHKGVAPPDEWALDDFFDDSDVEEAAKVAAQKEAMFEELERMAQEDRMAKMSVETQMSMQRRMAREGRPKLDSISLF